MRRVHLALVALAFASPHLGCGASTPTSETVDVADVTAPSAAPTASASSNNEIPVGSKPHGTADVPRDGDGFCGRPYAPGAEAAYARAKTLVDLLAAEGHPSMQEGQRGMRDLETAADGGIREAEWDFGRVVFSMRFGDHAPRPDERDLYVRAFKHIRLAARRGDKEAAESFPDLAQPTLPPKFDEPLAQFDRTLLEEGARQADLLLACK